MAEKLVLCWLIGEIMLFIISVVLFIYKQPLSKLWGDKIKSFGVVIMQDKPKNRLLFLITGTIVIGGGLLFFPASLLVLVGFYE